MKRGKVSQYHSGECLLRNSMPHVMELLAGQGALAQAASHSYISPSPVAATAAVFIVYTLAGVQSKHTQHCQVPHRPGQEANHFIHRLFAE